MFITFLISSLAHELVMSCITKKLRGYGFLAMMLQMPIVAVQKSRYFRGKTTLNVCFLSPLGFAFACGMGVLLTMIIEYVFLVFDDFGAFDGMFLFPLPLICLTLSILYQTNCYRCAHSTSLFEEVKYLLEIARPDPARKAIKQPN